MALRNIAFKEGRRGLFAGYGSFLLRDLPFDAIEFVAYEQFKKGWVDWVAAAHDLRAWAIVWWLQYTNFTWVAVEAEGRVGWVCTYASYKRRVGRLRSHQTLATCSSKTPLALHSITATRAW